MRKSQKQNIKAALENGVSITHLEAMNWFGCARLAARIKDLRDEGMSIQTTTVKEGRKTFARYSLRRK
jgi:hypothetical protein